MSIKSQKYKTHLASPIGIPVDLFVCVCLSVPIPQHTQSTKPPHSRVVRSPQNGTGVHRDAGDAAKLIIRIWNATLPSPICHVAHAITAKR